MKRSASGLPKTHHYSQYTLLIDEGAVRYLLARELQARLGSFVVVDRAGLVVVTQLAQKLAAVPNHAFVGPPAIGILRVHRLVLLVREALGLEDRQGCGVVAVLTH